MTLPSNPHRTNRKYFDKPLNGEKVTKNSDTIRATQGARNNVKAEPSTMSLPDHTPSTFHPNICLSVVCGTKLPFADSIIAKGRLQGELCRFCARTRAEQTYPIA